MRVSLDGTGSSDADGSITDYVWTFGDGNAGTGPLTSHTYAAAGTYEITLTVVDDRGGEHSATEEVQITGPAAPVTYATDTFNRTVNNGRGAADIGGQRSRERRVGRV